MRDTKLTLVRTTRDAPQAAPASESDETITLRASFSIPCYEYGTVTFDVDVNDDGEYDYGEAVVAAIEAIRNGVADYNGTENYGDYEITDIEHAE